MIPVIMVQPPLIPRDHDMQLMITHQRRRWDHDHGDHGWIWSGVESGVGGAESGEDDLDGTGADVVGGGVLDGPAGAHEQGEDVGQADVWPDPPGPYDCQVGG